MSKNINARIALKRDTSANWTNYNPVLLDGELILVDTAEGQLRAKVGDGTKTYTQLPFTDEALRALITDVDNNNSAVVVTKDGESRLLDTFNIIKLTQEEYEELEASDSLDPDALYLTEGDGSLDILNDNGIIKKEHLPDGYPYSEVGEILPSETVEIDPDVDEGYISTSFALALGGEYTVMWNGMEYSCVGQEFSLDGIPAVAVGNVGALTDGDLTEEPFAIINLDAETAAGIGAYGIVIAFDDSTTATVAISGTLVNKISAVYLPKMGVSNIVDGKSIGSLRSVMSAKESDEYTLGVAAVAEGFGTIASGTAAHAEGDGTTASGEEAHAEGLNTTASDWAAHAEGANTTASGQAAHAEGFGTIASAYAAHAEGLGTTASGDDSHAEGYFTEAVSDHQHVQGKYNRVDSDNKYAHIVGNGRADGTEDGARSNAHTLDWDGNAWYQGHIKVGGTGWDDATDEVAYKSDITKSNLGLGNVENKSSATIRSELTKDDITNALGYTPPEEEAIIIITENTNLNYFVTPGWYRINNSLITNGPVSEDYKSDCLINIAYASELNDNEFFPYSTSTIQVVIADDIYRRTKTALSVEDRPSSFVENESWYSINKITYNTKTNLTGLLKGNGSTVQVAQAGTDYATPPKTVIVTLSAAGWSDNIQTVSVQDATDTNVKVISPALASVDEYASCGIKATAEGAGTITFACTIVPENDLTVNIAILG